LKLHSIFGLMEDEITACLKELMEELSTEKEMEAMKQTKRKTKRQRMITKRLKEKQDDISTQQAQELLNQAKQQETENLAQKLKQEVQKLQDKPQRQAAKIQYLSKFSPEEEEDQNEPKIGYRNIQKMPKSVDSLTQILSEISEDNYVSQNLKTWAVCAQKTEPIEFLQTNEEMDSLDVDSLITKELIKKFLSTDDAMDSIDVDSLIDAELDDRLISELNDPEDQKAIENQIKEQQMQIALQILDTEVVPAESMEIQEANNLEKEISWLKQQILAVQSDRREYAERVAQGKPPNFELKELDMLEKDYQHRLQETLNKQFITIHTAPLPKSKSSSEPQWKDQQPKMSKITIEN